MGRGPGGRGQGTQRPRAGDPVARGRGPGGRGQGIRWPGAVDRQLLFLQGQNFISPWDKWGHPGEASASCCYPKNYTYRDSSS